MCEVNLMVFIALIVGTVKLLHTLLHAHQPYSCQSGDPAVGVCVSVRHSWQKTQFMGQRHGCSLWRADAERQMGVSPLFAEIQGPLHQLRAQRPVAPPEHHGHVGHLAVTAVSSILVKLWASSSSHSTAVAVVEPRAVVLVRLSAQHGQHAHHPGLAPNVRLRHPQTVAGVFQVVGLNVGHVCLQPPAQVALVDLLTAVINEAGPGASKQQSQEVGAASQHVTSHGEAQSDAHMVWVAHGLEERRIHVLQDPIAKER